jgi:hypothetical protein
MPEFLDQQSSPKNGDKKTEKDGTTFVFRYGSWIKEKKKIEKKSYYS